MPDSFYVRLPVRDVTLGMYLHELCGSWMDHPFWRRRFLLEDPEDLRRLRESGVLEVLIDPGKGLSPRPVLAPGEPATAPPPVSPAAPIDRSTSLTAAWSKRAPVNRRSSIESTPFL